MEESQQQNHVIYSCYSGTSPIRGPRVSEIGDVYKIRYYNDIHFVVIPVNATTYHLEFRHENEEVYFRVDTCSKTITTNIEAEGGMGAIFEYDLWYGLSHSCIMLSPHNYTGEKVLIRLRTLANVLSDSNIVSISRGDEELCIIDNSFVTNFSIDSERRFRYHYNTTDAAFFALPPIINLINTADDMREAGDEDMTKNNTMESIK